MIVYDGFVTPPNKPPTVGSNRDQCLAVKAIPHKNGNPFAWHCQLSEEQWEFHSQNGMRSFWANRGIVGKAIVAKDKGGKDVAKTAPIHTFFGMGVRDGETQTLYTGDAGEDISTRLSQDLSAMPADVGAAVER